MVNLKMKLCLSISLVCAGLAASAADITTLDGQKYEDVRDITPKHNGLYFTIGSGMAAKGITVAYTNLPNEIKDLQKKQATAKPASTASR